MNESCRVLIVDDHPLFRRGLVQLLRTIPAFVLVGEAASGAEGLALARELRPDLILLDLNMRDGDGLDMLRGLRTARSEARVVMVTVSDSGEDVVAALRGGAEVRLSQALSVRAGIDGLGEAYAGLRPAAGATFEQAAGPVRLRGSYAAALEPYGNGLRHLLTMRVLF